MKIYLSKSAILQGVQTVQRAVPLKSPMLTLQSILLTALDNRITFAATDMEIGIRYSHAAEIEEEGSVLLPAKLLFEIIRRLPEDIIECESKGRNFILRYGDADFTINGYDPEEYPEIGGFIPTTTMTLPGKILKKFIQQVYFASKIDEESGNIFSGILLEIQGENLTLAATDTHRMAVNTGNFSTTGRNPGGNVVELVPKTKQSWIIPNKSMMEISRLLRNDDEVTIEGHRESARINFKFSDTEVLTRLINGQYPNYKQVIPNQSGNTIIFTRTVLLEAVERAALLSKDAYLKTSILRFQIEDGQIIINQAAEMGKIFEKIPIEYSGNTMIVTFNLRYIIDALKNIETEKVSMEIASPYSPCIFRPYESEEDENYISLVLPLRH
ncbi:MAG: DNA polymerase III subunit beta [Peptococcaceae bacterium]|nr:DNA polymerase III subunit beta [Peptococcaceae bacterium]